MKGAGAGYNGMRKGAETTNGYRVRVNGCRPCGWWQLPTAGCAVLRGYSAVRRASTDAHAGQDVSESRVVTERRWCPSASATRLCWLPLASHHCLLQIM